MSIISNERFDSSNHSLLIIDTSSFVVFLRKASLEVSKIYSWDDDFLSFHHKVSSDMLAMRKHAQVCSNSFKWEYGFSSSSPEKD